MHFQAESHILLYAQTTYSFTEDFRLVSGIRYSEDTFSTNVANFYNVDVFEADW